MIILSDQKTELYTLSLYLKGTLTLQVLVVPFVASSSRCCFMYTVFIQICCDVLCWCVFTKMSYINPGSLVLVFNLNFCARPVPV
jgi:hypothetical protein